MNPSFFLICSGASSSQLLKYYPLGHIDPIQLNNDLRANLSSPGYIRTL